MFCRGFLMKRYWQWWKHGWHIGIRLLAFNLALGLFGLPIWVIASLMPGVDDEPILGSWRSVVYIVVILLWLPLALCAAAAYTREFQGAKSSRNGAGPDGPANQPQRVGPGANRTSPAAGSGG
jgi:hypothetical protein